MASQGIMTRTGVCAICDETLSVGELVYYDFTKRQGKHLVHVDCWETLLRGRGPRPRAKGAERMSTEPLDAPF